MHCTIRKMLDKGMTLPRTWFNRLPWVAGDFLMIEQFDEHRRRHVRVAMLMRERSEPEVLPLFDAHIIQVKSDFMIVNGIERHEDIVSPTIEYPQSWWVEFANGADRHIEYSRRTRRKNPA